MEMYFLKLLVSHSLFHQATSEQHPPHSREAAFHLTSHRGRQRETRVGRCSQEELKLKLDPNTGECTVQLKVSLGDVWQVNWHEHVGKASVQALEI